MKILDMPNSSRPRERFLKVGPGGLSDAFVGEMVGERKK